MPALKRDLKKLKSGKKVTYLRIVENRNINGKQKRTTLENLGVLGKDLTLSEAKAILREKYATGLKQITEKYTLASLYEAYAPLYKQEMIQSMFFKAKLVHKADDIEHLERMVEEKRYRLSNYEIYTREMNRAIDFMGDVLIKKMDIDDSRKYLNYLVRDCKLSANTVRICFVELRKTLKYAVAKGWLRNIPLISGLSEINKLTTNHSSFVKEADTYSDEELAKMYMMANDNQRFLMALFMETAMRPEEVDKFHLKDALVTVDLKKNIIIVNSYRANKKGRLIPLSSKLKLSIEERIAMGQIKNKISPYSKTVYSRRSIQRLTTRAGIKNSSRKCNLKMFRATKNTHMIRNNVEGAIRANLLGNSMEVQTNHYTGSVMENLRKIVETERPSSFF